jgi:hypothetical protein
VTPFSSNYWAAQEENRKLLEEKKLADKRDREFNRKEHCRRNRANAEARGYRC